MKKQAFFRRADLLLIAVIAAVCMFFFLPKQMPKQFRAAKRTSRAL